MGSFSSTMISQQPDYFKGRMVGAGLEKMGLVVKFFHGFIG
jgi:hypothetical protein